MLHVHERGVTVKQNQGAGMRSMRKFVRFSYVDQHTSIKFDLQPRNVKSEEASNIRFQTMHDHVHYLGLIVG